MTKPKTVQAFEAEYDDGPTRELKNVPADLVAFESYKLGKLSSPLASALSDFVLGWTVWEPTAKARVAHTKKVLEVASNDQRTADAQVASKLLRKGPSAFGDLAGALDEVDLVAQSEEAHNYAVRTATAIRAATDGQQRYMNGLVGGSHRTAFLDMLDKAWQTYVVVNPSSSTTLGELAQMKSLSAEARELVGRLLIYAEGQNNGGSFDAEELQTVRRAVNGEDWDVLPTIERIKERAAISASSADEEAEEQARRTLEEADEENRKYAAQNAQYRRGLGREEESEAAPVATAV